MKIKNKFFKRALSGVLSAACVFSGTAFAGTVAMTNDAPIEAKAAASTDTPQFSWDNATVYFLLTDRFKNGDTSNDGAYDRVKTVAGDSRATFHGGDFKGITDKINDGYFNDLGVNAIWMTAPYEQLHGYILGDGFAHYSYHGYYVTDYTEPDAAYGTRQEFQTLVDTAHEHGIRIIMDIVMNHAGYNNMIDMNEYNYGTLLDGWKATYDAGDLSNYHKKIDYESSATDWGRWWGSDWVRSGLPGYTPGGNDDQTRTLEGLPDFKTESSNQVGIPQFLKTKWKKEGTLSSKMSKYGSSNTVTGYISTWLAEWVETYGVDGFRCDTAKHVEYASWNKLKQAGVAALKKWRQNNPGKAGADWTDDFWMTGECWGHGSNKDGYYTEGGFDSMINFETQGGGLLAAGNVANVYDGYAGKINSDSSFNLLSYISSHDTVLARGDQYYLGSALLMLPGGVQIYYGDETCRPLVPGVAVSGDGHAVRSDMNWDSMDKNVLAHWQKVGTFRNNHLAVGAGQNVKLSASAGIAFGRTYSKNGTTDKIIGVINAGSNVDVSIDVGDVFANGTQLHNYYDDSYAVVSGGKVTFNCGAHGTILIEIPSGPRGVVKVTHIDKDTNKTIKEESLSGGIGESYQTSALSMDGYKVASTTGKTSGTFTEAEIDVTYYYTFDSANYGFVVTKYVDEAGAEIAESVTETKKVGTTYSTTPANIKNYEVDVTPTNATGTVKTGTTTVTYKYKYVEPDNLIVHYYQASSWPAMYIYAYDESSGTAKRYTGAWPGSKMTSDGNNWYSYSVDDVESAQVIFNSGSDANKDPSGSLAPGYEATGEVWIKDAKVYPTGKVSVKYTGSDGKVLGSEIIKGMADGTNTYTTTAKTFDGYELTSTPTNATGKFVEGTTTVNYVYKSTVEEVLPTGITLSKTSLSIAKGKSAALTATVAPSNATDKSVTWSSSNTAVATVSNGTVKGVKAGTATITAKTSNGKTATCKVTVTDVTALANNSTVSADLVNINTKVTITGKASGGTSPYTYAFYYKKSSATSWTTIGTAFGTATTGSFTPKTEDIYDVKVVVKDSTGATATWTSSVEVMNMGEDPEALANNSTISATSVSPNTAVKITGKASGGTSPYTYAFYYKLSSDTSWKTIGTAFGTATTGTFTPTTAGTYEAKAVVKDSASKTAVQSFTVVVKTSNELQNTSTISSKSVAACDAVKMTGKATGGAGSYKYAFYFKKSTESAYTLIGQAYGTATSATFYPSEAGTYNALVRVKDAKGKVSKLGFTVKVAAATTTLKNNSTINNTTVSLGNAVKITGVATGGKASYTYAFSFKRSKNVIWKTLGTEWGTASTAKVVPTSAGYYDFRVMIKDSEGKVATKQFKVTVKEAGLKNTSKISSEAVDVNTAVKITGSASGGTSPYTYAFYYKKSDSSSWTTIGTAFGTATSATFTPKTSATYDIKAVVKDSAGKTATASFTVVAF